MITMNDLVKSPGTGIELLNDSGAVLLSSHELMIHGCRNCVWKLHGMCKHGLSIDETLPEGICEDFTAFLSSLVPEGDSTASLLEQYNIYVLRLQSLQDYNQFCKLNNELMVLEGSNPDGLDLDKIESKRNSYKLWWTKLNIEVLKSLSKVVDRQVKQNSNKVTKMTIQQFNTFMNEGNEKLLEKK